VQTSGQSAALRAAKTRGPIPVDAAPIDQLLGVVQRQRIRVDDLEKVMSTMALRAGIATQGSGLRSDNPAWAAALPALRPIFDIQQKAELGLSAAAEKYVKLGTDMREVAVKENFAAMFMMVISRVFDGLDLTPEQVKTAPRLVENALLLLEAGQ
jgi:hypothetical protein